MAVGQGLVAQALLGAPVVVVVVVRRLLVRSIALVPAPQMLRHQRLLHVLADVLQWLRRRGSPVPGRPQGGVRVAVRHAVHFVGAVVGVVRRRRVVGRGVDAVVALGLVVVHVQSVGVRLRLSVGGVACHVVGGGGGPGPGLRGVTACVRLRQVGHAASVGVDIPPMTSADPTPGAVVARDGIFHAGLAGVG